ncbi:MAG TPA: hypothetical protein VIC57_16745 [Candidatus Dormibacteraeota bacterium]|jgi:hypothetical protein
MTAMAAGVVRPTRAGLIGLLIGSAVAIVAAVGPLGSAIWITIGVETQVGDATGLPTAGMLPAALEGLGAVALVYLVARRPAGAMRTWCVVLIAATLLAGMAAQGSHALWFDEATRRLALPWQVKLFVSFVPPLSGAAALHLVVKMAEGLIATVRELQALPVQDDVEDLRPAAAPPPPAGMLADTGDDAAGAGRALPADTKPAPPGGTLADGAGADAEAAIGHAPDLPADTPEPPPDGRPRAGRRPASKRGVEPVRGHARGQASRLSGEAVKAIVARAREHVLAGPDRDPDKAIDVAIVEHLAPRNADERCPSCGVHPLSRSRVRTYLADLRREAAGDGSEPARRPRVVHLEASPAGASARAQEA